MTRRAARVNREWETPLDPWTWEHVQIEVLMDIRAELQKLNTLLHCSNFVNIPRTLNTISRKIPVKPRRRA